MKKKLIFILLLFFVNFNIYSQETKENTKVQNEFSGDKSGKAFAGFGFGLQYGGIGGKIEMNISDEFRAFMGIGNFIIGIGYNLGLRLDFHSYRRTQFYLISMYGTNGLIKIQGIPQNPYDKIYTGISFGLGMKIKLNRSKGNYFDIGLLIPIKSSEFENDMKKLYNNPFISDIKDPNLILVSLGLNFSLN